MNKSEMATASCVKSLLDNYDIGSVPKTRLIVGSYIPAIDQARAATGQRWLDDFGVELPESIAFQGYTLSSDETFRLDLSTARVLESTNPKVQANLVTLGIMHSNCPKLEICNIAATTRRETYRSVLDYATQTPNMLLSQPTEQVPIIQTTQSKRNDPRYDLDCVIGVFGMSAVHLNQAGVSPQEFDTKTARQVTNVHPKAPPRAIYDLSFMMSLLTTPYAEQQSQHTTRVCTVVGADLGEIEKKIIAPILKKDPRVRFIINAVLASDSNLHANHAVSVIEASDEIIRVQDPKYASTQEIPAETFWQRWITTNMQAGIAIVKPL